MFVKVCGLTREEDVDAAAEAGADAVGFVLAESRRQLSLSRARELAERIEGRAMSVAVVVDHDDLGALECFDAVQVHGRAAGVHRQIIRAVAELPSDATGHTDRLLLDASHGTGATADWQALAGRGGAFILSGGLTPDNVGEAVRLVKPFGVDVSSGVEVSPGVKDPELIKCFVERARSA